MEAVNVHSDGVALFCIQKLKIGKADFRFRIYTHYYLYPKFKFGFAEFKFLDTNQ